MLVERTSISVIPNTDVVYKTMYSVLNHHTTPPSCQDPVQKEFISKAVQLLTAMGTYDRDYFMELLVQLMEADSDVRLVYRIQPNDYTSHYEFPKRTMR